MSVRLALAQTAAELDGPAWRLTHLRGLAARAREGGADLLLLPELYACGYHIGSALRDRAEPADGPTFAAVQEIARATGIAIHYGYAEAAGGAIFNAAQCVGPDGARLVHQRKLAIPPGWERDWFTPGGGCALFSLGGMTFATLICYDIEFAETARNVAALGAQAILVPTALGAAWGWVARQMVPTRGFENGVYLAYANHSGTERGLDYLGQSFIGAPDGVELVRAGEGPELILADLDPERVAAAQARLPYLSERRDLRL
jgi:predicted amidohydrolase